jgi:uncharacterized protein
MIFLVDTNIWLERLLQQDKSDEVQLFLENVPSYNLAISDFTLHSIGVILFRLKKEETFNTFVSDIFVNEDVQLFSLNGLEHEELLSPVKKFSLDFDDAYQYVITKKYELQLVTFDKDFNQTDILAMTPLPAIKEFKNKI